MKLFYGSPLINENISQQLNYGKFILIQLLSRVGEIKYQKIRKSKVNSTGFN